ncbi:MAG: serine/threonine-protein kinase [Mycobacterium sp.]
MPRPGEDFHGYVVGEELGRGGSATVYLAHQVSAPERGPVALKVLSPRQRTDTGLDRIAREFDFAYRLHHRHIVEMYERGPDWLTMRYLDGGNAGTLKNLDTQLEALAEIADALDYAHRQGVVHCDVKPSNILVHKTFSQGGAVLIDFGVAHSPAADVAHLLTRDASQRLSLDPAKRITHQWPAQTATVQASLPYAAPELLTGRTPSAATDQYALACTAVEILTGTPPFVASTAAAVIDAQIHQPAPQLSRTVTWIPRAFDSVLTKALAKNPDMRYESCQDLIRLITGILR